MKMHGFSAFFLAVDPRFQLAALSLQLASWRAGAGAGRAGNREMGTADRKTRYSRAAVIQDAFRLGHGLNSPRVPRRLEF